MTTILEASRTKIDTRARRLPDLNRMPIPKFLDEAKGFESVAQFRDLHKSASDAIASYRRAEASIDQAATADAEAEAAALIDGKPKPARKATAKAIADADAAFADAHAAILASNSVRPQVFDAIRGKAGGELAAEASTTTEARRIAALNHLVRAADEIAGMQQTAAIPDWIAEIRSKNNLDLAVGPMPSPRMGSPIVTADGTSPAQLAGELMAALENLGRESVAEQVAA